MPISKKKHSACQHGLDLHNTYIVHKVKLPLCCHVCKNLVAIKNEVMQITTIDCKKKIFFPTKKHSCDGRES